MRDEGEKTKNKNFLIPIYSNPSPLAPRPSPLAPRPSPLAPRCSNSRLFAVQLRIGQHELPRSVMSKFVIALGNIVAASLVVAIIYGGYLIVRTKHLNEDATEYSEKAIRAMVDAWDSNEFVKRAA